MKNLTQDEILDVEDHIDMICQQAAHLKHFHKGMPQSELKHVIADIERNCHHIRDTFQ